MKLKKSIAAAAAAAMVSTTIVGCAQSTDTPTDTSTVTTTAIPEVDVAAGKATTLTASGAVSSWVSSDASILTVDADGVATAVGAGTVTVTATLEDGSTEQMSVAAIDPAVVVDTTTLSLVTNGENSATITAEGHESVVFSFSASNDNISVDENGVVTANTAGKAFVTVVAKVNGVVIDNAKVTVNIATNAESIEVTAASSELEVNTYTGEATENTSTTVEVSVNPTGATTDATFASSDESVATVDSNGNVTAVSGGSATITATSEEGFEASCDITVTRTEEDIQAQADAEAAAAKAAAEKAAAEKAAAEQAAAQAAADAAAAQAAADAAAQNSSTSTDSGSSGNYDVYLGTDEYGDYYMHYNDGSDLVDVPDNVNGTTFID